MKVIAALVVGAVLRFCGLWLGCLAWWLVQRGLRVEDWAGVRGRWDDWQADDSDWKVGGAD